MGKASSNKRETGKTYGNSEPESAVSSGNLKKAGLLQKTFIHIILIIALGLIAYSNTFQSPFQWDEEAQILDNPVIKDIDNFISNTKGYTYVSSHYNPRRAIGYLSFALNYHFGGPAVTGYHIVNLLIHIINAMLVYFLVVLTFRTPFFSGQRSADSIHQAVSNDSPFTIHHSRSVQDSRLIALFTALLFISHPIQTQAVTYVVQRFASLAAMFYLLSLLMYITGRLASRQAGKLASFILSLLFALLAMKTKEITFTLPILVAFYEFVFFRSSAKRKIIFIFCVALFLVVILVSILQSDKPFGAMLSDVLESTRVQTMLPRWDYFMTQMRVITTYIRLIFLPVNQNLDYAYPIEHSLFTPPVFFSLFFLLSLFGLAIYLLFKSRQADKLSNWQAGRLASFHAGKFEGEDGFHRSLFTTPYSRLVGFGIIWFFITLSVESSIIPIIDVIFEHRVYLPSVGLLAAITTGVFIMAQRMKMEKTSVFLLIFITLVFSGFTYARNEVWKSSISLWGDVIEKSPNKARPYNNRGIALGKIGQLDKAIEDFDKAIALDPSYSDAYNNRGTAFRQKGQLDKAIVDLDKAIVLAPSFADAHNSRGVALGMLGELDKALADFDKAIALDPSHAKAYNNRSTAYGKMGQFDKAIEDLDKAIALNPSYAEAHNNLGNIYVAQGRIDDALREFQTVLKLNPDNIGARNNLEKLNRMLREKH